MSNSIPFRKTYILSVAICIQVSFASAQALEQKKTLGSQLSLATFLNEVATGNEAFKAADWNLKGSRLQSAEGRLITRPSLVAGASAFTLGEANPLTSVNTFRSTAYSLGLNEATDFGFSGKLTLNQSKLEANSSSFVGGYTSSWTQLEFTQSLWRNWAGREISAQVIVKESGALANAFNQSYLSKTILLDAESSYWRLALAREQVTIAQDAVNRAQKLVEWAERRTRLQLSDRAEYLQTSTALQARNLDLRTAQDSERAAAQAFNSSRGMNSNVVTETLTDLNPENVAGMKIPEHREVRDDIKAAELQAKVSSAAAQLGRESNKPTLEVYGSIPLVPPADPPAQFAAIIPPTMEPGTTVGVRLSMPLWFGASNDARQGYNLQASAAEANFRRKTFEGERDWTDLVTKFDQARTRLSLYQSLEKQQSEKLLYERERQTRGRTTLQQVLLYETDLQLAQQGRISTLAELLTLNAQMKLYGVSYESR